MRWPGELTLLVNDVGEYLFVPFEVFTEFSRHRLDRSHPSFAALKARHFLSDTDSDAPIELMATKYRTKKSFLNGFTRLHLFVVTLRCDHSCRYCQVSRVGASRSQFDMSEETAQRSIDLMFQSPARTLKVEFQGGEPLLNFDLVRFIVERVKNRNQSEQRDVQFVIATNLAPLTDEILEYLNEHSILISTSLDGPEELHNRNRPRPGNDSHAITIRNIERARDVLGSDRVSAIMTTTKKSLNYPKEIIDEYVLRGFDAIFLRPISPYGFAVRTGEALRYETQEFLTFYKTALHHIIELNRSGVNFVEVYAQILLTKMLTPFPTGYVDLQSPAGTGLGAVAYNYDGDVYASDEARMLAAMGDHSFRLGNVHNDTFQELFGGQVMQSLVSGSVLESLPGCSDCAFLPYCGADPIFNYRAQGDIVGHRPSSAFCQKNMELIRHLFCLLDNEELFVRDLLTSWATNVRLMDRTGRVA